MNEISSPVEELAEQDIREQKSPPPSRAKTIFWNFASLSSAAVFGRLAGLATNAVLARRVSASGYGIAGIAQTVTLYFNLLSDLGLGTAAVREGAQNPGKLQSVISSMIGLRLALAFAVIPLGLVTARYLPYSNASQNLFRIYLLTLPIQALSVEWVFRSIQKMYLNTVLQVVGALLTFLFTIALVRNPQDLIRIAGIAAVAAAAMVGVGFHLLRREGLHAWPVFSFREFRHWLAQSLPLCLTSFAITLYTQANNLILGAFGTEASVGLYVAATRLSWVCYSPVWFYFTAMAPALSEAWAQSTESARSLLANSVRVSTIISLGGGLLGTSLSQWVMTRIFGKAFSGASAAFDLLVWTGVVIAIGYNWSELCVAARRNRLLLQSTCLGAVVNLAVCAATVTRMGIRGAALGNLLAEVAVHVLVLSSFGWHLGFSVLREAVRPLVAGAGAYGISFVTRASGPPLCAAFTISSYVVLLFLIGAITVRDLSRLRNLIPARRLAPEASL